MPVRRRHLIGLATAAATLGAARAAPLNERVAGPGGDFASVAEAMADITDAGPLNPHRVRLLPGTLGGGWSTKPWVTVQGAGRRATVIECDHLTPVSVGGDTELADMTIVYRGAGGIGETGALRRAGRMFETYLSRLIIDVGDVGGRGDPVWCLYVPNGGHGIFMNDVVCHTESCGFSLAGGHYRMEGCSAYFRPGSTDVPHIGLRVTGGARLDWFGGRVGTGYYWDQDLQDPTQPVLGIYVPADNTTGNIRVQLRDLVVYARSLPPATDLVNAIRAENGWLRCHSIRAQTETGGTDGSWSFWTQWGTPQQPPEGRGGLIEITGCTGAFGPGYVVGGSGAHGVSGPYDSDVQLDFNQRGLALVSAATRDVTVTLPWTRWRHGEEIAVKRVDDNPATTVTVVSDKSFSTIDGGDRFVLGPRQGATFVAVLEGWVTL